MDLTYFGHSTFQIETKGRTILVDPFFTDNPHTDVAPGAVDADVILLTHAHFDHWGDTPAIAERTGALVISNFEITGYLTQQHGHENVQPLNEGGSVNYDWGTVEATHARHTSSFPDGTYGGTPNGHILHVEGACIYNTGDTAPFAEMKWIGQDHDVDVALMPIGDCFTQGIEKAVDAVTMIDPALTVPLHYDTFPPIEVDMGDWRAAMEAEDHDTRVLDFGETIGL